MLESISKTKVQYQARIRKKFDYDWRFVKEDRQGACGTDFYDGDWRKVTLPHDWSIEGTFSEDAPTGGSGAYLPAGIGWYRKHFSVPAEWADKKVMVEFDGVMLNSTVWVNGNYLGNRPYGYSSFAYELTPFLDFGGENVIAVKIDASLQPSSRWYEGCGIYRHVYLTAVNKVHVKQWGTKTATKYISEEMAAVEIVTRAVNESDGNRSVVIESVLLDGEGKEVLSARKKDNMASGEEKAFTQVLTVEKPHLWKPDSPYIYRIHTKLWEEEELLDDYATAVGIRQFGYDIEKGFSINGERMMLQGMCIHHDAGCVGAAIPERIMERRLLKLKAAGCNAIRLSHYPHTPELLDMLDTIGFVAIGEAFDEWAIGRPKTKDVGTNGLPGECDYGYCEYFADWAERDLRDLIRRDYNHACIAFWSIGNEIPEQCRPQGGAMARKLVDICHAEDPTRPVTSACMDTSGVGEQVCTDEYMEALDIIGVNYVDVWGDMKETYYQTLHDKFPHKIFMGTEHTSPGGGRGCYDLYQHFNQFYGMYYNSMIDIEQRHKFLKMHPYVLGDFMWIANDYLGEAGWPWRTPGSGIMDSCGYEKDSYYLMKSIWQTKENVLYLMPHWNWEGHEKEAIPVICYTNCDYVELFLNGQSYGRKCWQFPRPGMTKYFSHYDVPVLEITTSDLHLSWNIPYEAGELKAVGYKDQKAVMETIVRTVKKAAAVRLETDTDVIEADGQDAVQCFIDIIDENGDLVPGAETEVKIRVEGPGCLAGMDNGSPLVDEGFHVSAKKAFNGKLLAVVRSTGEKGRIVITADSVFGTQQAEVRAE